MTTKYFVLLTNHGAAKLANADALGTKVDHKEMAVGDGGGMLGKLNIICNGMENPIAAHITAKD